MNFHEKENAKDLVKHLDWEIESAIGRGCSVFFAGTRYPEDDIFAERVIEAAKPYAEGEVVLKRMESESNEALKKCFLNIADWEIYPFEED